MKEDSRKKCNCFNSNIFWRSNQETRVKWKRIYQKNFTRKGNYFLNIEARNAGIKKIDKFHNFGYKGLYNGETANDISKRKKCGIIPEDLLTPNKNLKDLDNKRKILKKYVIIILGWWIYEN